MAGPPQKAVFDSTNLANFFIADSAALHLALLIPEEHRLGSRLQQPYVIDGPAPILDAAANSAQFSGALSPRVRCSRGP